MPRSRLRELLNARNAALTADPDWQRLYLTRETYMTVHLLRDKGICSQTIGLQWIPLTRNQCLVYRREMQACNECWHKSTDLDAYIGARITVRTA